MQGREDLADEHGRRALETAGRRAAEPLDRLGARTPRHHGTGPVRPRAGCHAWQAGARGSRASRLGRRRQRRAGDDRVGASPGRRLRGHRGHRACGRGRTLGRVPSERLSRALNSAAVALQIRGDLQAAFTMRLEAAQVGKRLGDAHHDAWHESILSDHQYRLGEWGEALRRADAVIGLWEAGTTTNTIVQAHIVRGEIRMARDDPAGAVADVDRALELADAIGVAAQPLCLCPLRGAAPAGCGRRCPGRRGGFPLSRRLLAWKTARLRGDQPADVRVCRGSTRAGRAVRSGPVAAARVAMVGDRRAPSWPAT